MNNTGLPQPVGDLHQWAQQLVQQLQSSSGQLPYLESTTQPARDGQIFYYPTSQEVVVYIGGSYYPFTMGAAK